MVCFILTLVDEWVTGNQAGLRLMLSSLGLVWDQLDNSLHPHSITSQDLLIPSGNQFGEHAANSTKPGERIPVDKFELVSTIDALIYFKQIVRHFPSSLLVGNVPPFVNISWNCSFLSFNPYLGRACERPKGLCPLGPLWTIPKRLKTFNDLYPSLQWYNW